MQKEWLSWWAITFAKVYTVKSKGMRRKLTKIVGLKINSIKKGKNLDCQTQGRLNTCTPTMPYVKAWEINLWMCWTIGESDPGPFAPAIGGLTTELPRPLWSLVKKQCIFFNKIQEYVWCCWAVQRCNGPWGMERRTITTSLRRSTSTKPTTSSANVSSNTRHI